MTSSWSQWKDHKPRRSHKLYWSVRTETKIAYVESVVHDPETDLNFADVSLKPASGLRLHHSSLGANVAWKILRGKDFSQSWGKTGGY